MEPLRFFGCRLDLFSRVSPEVETPERVPDDEREPQPKRSGHRGRRIMIAPVA